MSKLGSRKFWACKNPLFDFKLSVRDTSLNNQSIRILTVSLDLEYSVLFLRLVRARDE